MNQANALTARLAAFALSSILTLAMLAGTDHLATSQPPAGLLAQTTLPAHTAPQI